MSFCNHSIYSNLTDVATLGSDTVLCIDGNTKKLYVKKTVDASFRSLYENIACLESPSLARIKSVEGNSDTAVVIREYISGSSIAELVAEGRLFDTKSVCSIALQLCEGLSVLHKRGFVHRDVSANNVIITHGGHAIIIDYGIARSFQNEKNSDTVILGTPGYAAPEQFGFKQSDARTDIYALGVLMNVMLTGKLPSEKKAEGDLWKIIQRCTMIDPQKRYNDVNDLKRAIMMISQKGNDALSPIPGFRGSGWLYRLRTVVLYLLIFLLTFGMLGDLTIGARNYLLSLLSWICVIGVPYFLIGDPFSLRSKLLGSYVEQSSQKSLSYIISTVLILVGIVLFGSF